MTAHNPFTELLGIEDIAAGKGQASLVMEVTDKIHNRRAVAHGGALATMLDTAMARAARSMEEGMDLGGTIDLNVKFMTPGSGRLVASARVVHATHSLAFCEGEVRNADNGLVATATATLRLRRNGASAA